jgi:hypothetical protein
MLSAGIITLGVGSASPAKLRKKEVEFYQWLLSVIFGEDIEILNIDEITSIPISIKNEDILDGKPYSAMWKIINEYSDKVDLCFIDIADPPNRVIPGKLDVQIAQSLTTFIELNPPEESKRLVILRHQLPPEGEIFYRILEKQIGDGSIILLDANGNFISKNPIGNTFDKDQFKFRLKESKGDPLDLLDIKMIRRVGHFKRAGQFHDPHCVRYIFNGSECERELIELITNFIINECESIKNLLILYHTEFSNWLEQPVLAVAESLEAKCEHISEFLEKLEDNTLKEDANILIVVPLIDTKKTIIRILENLKEVDETIEPKMLTILSTKGSERRNGSFDVPYNGKTYQARYFLNVERGRQIHPCPLCMLGLPITSLDKEDYLMLTTYDMWDMSAKAGWAPEPMDEKPVHRENVLEIVPIFRNLFHQNGAWLAHKTKDRIKKELIDFPIQPLVIVCPNEVGVNSLANHLKVIQGFSIINIPKSVINEIDLGPEIQKSLFDTWQNNNELWFRQLNETSPNQLVVIMEEYCVSGGTRAKLIRLIKKFGLEVFCHFAFLDLNFNLAAVDTVKTLSLYDLQLSYV